MKVIPMLMVDVFTKVVRDKVIPIDQISIVNQIAAMLLRIRKKRKLMLKRKKKQKRKRRLKRVKRRKKRRKKKKNRIKKLLRKTRIYKSKVRIPKRRTHQIRKKIRKARKSLMMSGMTLLTLFLMIKTSSKIQSRNQIPLMVFMARKSQARQNKHQCLSHKQKLITNWVKMDQIRIRSRIKMPKKRSKIKNLKAKLKKWPKLKKRLKLRQTLFPKFKKGLTIQKTKTVPPRRKRKKKKSQVMMMRIRLLVQMKTMQT